MTMIFLGQLVRRLVNQVDPPAPSIMPHQHRIVACALALIAAGLVQSSNGFIDPRPQRCVHRIGSSNNDEIFFDDFGDGFFDASSSSNNNNGNNSNLFSLQTRMSQVKNEEAAYDAKIARNWRRGNWGVRGFALDKSSYETPSSSTSPTDMPEEKPVHVSVVAAPTSSSYDDISLPQDRALPQDRMVAVGRTDGSVFVIKLGEQYLTQFMPVPKLVMGQEGDDLSVGVKNEWMDSDDVKDKLVDELPPRPESENVSEGDDQMTQTPFEIAHQFLASDQGEIINKLVYHDGIEGDDSGGIICAAAGSSGDISMWKLPSTEQGQYGVIQTSLLSGVHSDEIISLERMLLKEQNVLFSASRDGKVALWNLDKNGELILSCQCKDVGYDSMVSLTCADVSNPSSWDDDYSYDSENDNDVIFLGTSNGYVMGYLVQELFSGDTNLESECPEPILRFRAHGTDNGKAEGVTAIKCGGDGTIPTSARLRGGDESQASRNPNLSSSILLTGGEDGSVKQWEILSQKTLSSPTGVRMEHWPRLSTQRMKRRSHLFSPSHDGPVTCISQQGRHDSSKFLTGSQDGSVCVWSASSGKELYRMDGFSSISSLAFIGRELLVTDGMEQYVCVHDFGIEEDAASNGYDLEW